MTSDFAARMAAARAAKKGAATTKPAASPRKVVPVKKVSASSGGRGVVKRIELGGSEYSDDPAPGVAIVHVQHGPAKKPPSKGPIPEPKMSRIHMAADEARQFKPGQKVKVGLSPL